MTSARAMLCNQHPILPTDSSSRMTPNFSPSKPAFTDGHTGVVLHVSKVSRNSPDFFHLQHSSPRNLEGQSHFSPRLREELAATERGAGLKAEDKRPRCKAGLEQSSNQMSPQSPRSMRSPLYSHSAPQRPVAKLSVVSVESPEWMKSPLQSNREILADRGLADGVTSGGYNCVHNVRRTNLVNEETGQIANKTIVSRQAPDWMKAAFENNRDHFEQKGVTQKIQSRTGRAAGQSYVHDPATRTRKNNIVDEETGVLKNQSIVSPQSPDFMKSPFESNRQYFQSLGADQKLTGKANVERVSSRRVDMHSNSFVSSRAPGWMKEPLRSNSSYLVESGVAEKIQRVEESREECQIADPDRRCGKRVLRPQSAMAGLLAQPNAFSSTDVSFTFQPSPRDEIKRRPPLSVCSSSSGAASLARILRSRDQKQ
eukprot:TRINITY_DN51755_c0_g1_i1.p1 TRINITY_DN51755_c0_g1~~TRINITY_DN51755_c0_g1_i1.p1  ORF type:complete len:438 (+),score=49.96 TRINITY_DN51755_c0_g1_i1:36-1316(+)